MLPSVRLKPSARAETWIGLTLGQSAWEELVRTEGRIRKQRQETLYAQRERRRKFVEIAAWVLLVGVGTAILGSFVMLVEGAHRKCGGADDYLS